MTDIVERLREIACSMDRYDGNDLRKAAGEIERLRDEARLMRATAVPRDEYELLRGEIERLRTVIAMIGDDR